jgi:hypothetical protein
MLGEMLGEKGAVVTILDECDEGEIDTTVGGGGSGVCAHAPRGRLGATSIAAAPPVR